MYFLRGSSVERGRRVDIRFAWASREGVMSVAHSLDFLDCLNTVFLPEGLSGASGS